MDAATHWIIELMTPHKVAIQSMTFCISIPPRGLLGLWNRMPTDAIDVTERIELTTMIKSLADPALSVMIGMLACGCSVCKVIMRDKVQ